MVGHTGIGVYNDSPYSAYVDLKKIPDFYRIDLSGTDKITIGANVSLTDVINTFNDQSTKDGFQHLAQLAAIISRTAHHHVRNVSMKYFVELNLVDKRILFLCSLF